MCGPSFLASFLVGLVAKVKTVTLIASDHDIVVKANRLIQQLGLDRQVKVQDQSAIPA